VTLRRALWIAVPVLILGGLVLTWSWADVSKSERERVLAKACADAGGLRQARLLDEAIGEYAAISRADASYVCPREPNDEFAQTAGEWQQQLQWDAHTSARYAEQGDVYHRAFLLKSDPVDVAGRRIAQVRARRAYMVALYVDPGDPGARRNLSDVLTALGTPTKEPDADLRCNLAGNVFGAGLLPEARMVYAQALRSGRTTQCGKRGVRTIRQWRADAMTPLRAARRERAAGQNADARKNYIQAYAMDSSLTEAKQALADVPAPSLAGAHTGSRAKHNAGNVTGFIKSKAAWIKDNPDSSGLGAIVLGLLFLLAMAGLLRLARRRRLHKWMNHVGLLHRFTHLRVDVATFEHVDGNPARSVTDVFMEALSKSPLTPDGDARGELGDVDATTDVAPAAGTNEVEDWAAATPTLAGFAAILKVISNLTPRNEIRVNGRLLQPAERGAGLRVQVLTRRGRPLKSRQFWHREILPGAVADDDAYNDLARYAAPWARDRKAR
jgi:hypothetical protein